MNAFSAPRPLAESDELARFESDVALVDDWLTNRARRAMEHGTAVVYVVLCDSHLAGFYSLSAHSVLRGDVRDGRLRRNTPEQIPAVLLGMLGVDNRCQGQRLGSSLLRDAILRAQHVSSEIGARALIVDPVDDSAAAFYARYGFRAFPDLNRMFLPLA